MGRCLTSVYARRCQSRAGPHAHCPGLSEGAPHPHLVCGGEEEVDLSSGLYTVCGAVVTVTLPPSPQVPPRSILTSFG